MEFVRGTHIGTHAQPPTHCAATGQAINGLSYVQYELGDGVIARSIGGISIDHQQLHDALKAFVTKPKTKKGENENG